MGMFFFGVCVGVVGSLIGGLVERHLYKTKQRVRLEQEYEILRGQVNKCVQTIDRIINGS